MWPAPILQLQTSDLLPVWRLEMLKMHMEHLCVCAFMCQAYMQGGGGGNGGVPLSGCQLGGQIPDSIDRHIEQLISKQLIIDPIQITEKSQTLFL